MGDKSRHICSRLCKDYDACQAERGAEPYKALDLRIESKEEVSGHEEVRRVVRGGVDVYNDPTLGLDHLKDWVKRREEEAADLGIIANLFYESVLRRIRGHKTFMWSISENLEKDFVRDILNHNALREAFS